MKQVVRLLCPPAPAGRGLSFVAPCEGGLIHIDTGSSIEYHILLRGCHEPVVTDLIGRYVRPGDSCLDIGANIGALTLAMAAAAGSSGRIVAVEPHPAICKRLRANVELNQLDGRVMVVQAAVSDRDGNADFYGFGENAFHQGISSLLPDRDACRKMTVRSITGKTLLQEWNINRCNFLKIDVEGAESVVLEQLSALIEKNLPVIIFEYRKAHWTKFGHSFSETADRFRRLGYTLRLIRKRTLQPLPKTLPESGELLAVPEARRC